MTRKADRISRGYFGIGIYAPKTASNVGTLWRGAFQLGASFVFVIGKRYQKESSDTVKTWRHIPFFNCTTFDEFSATLLPFDCPLVAVEMGGALLHQYQHPQRCVYLLGAEDHGLPPAILERCHERVSIESVRTTSYNVAQAGTLVMYDRARQRKELVS